MKVIYEITNQCNLHCKMCDIWAEKKRKRLDQNDISQSLHKDIEHVSLTGGEPFLENLYSYYKAVRDITSCPMNISTNGTRPDTIKNFLKNVKNCNITISYDGESHDTIRGKSRSRVIEAAIASRKMVSSLKFTITPWNYHEIISAYELAKGLGIKFQVKMVEYIPVHYNRNTKPQWNFSTDALKAIKTQLKTIKAKNKTYVRNLISQLESKEYSCHLDTNNIFVSVDGSAFICRRSAPVGNIYRNTIKEIGESNVYRESASYIKNCSKECISYISQ